MISFPHCKINLGLYVLSKRSDAYHNIQSLFYPVKLCDALETIDADPSAKGFELHFSGLAIPGSQENNLVFKAWKLMKENYQLPAVKTFLHKIIPMGAGLGGGSADGAFMLRLLNEKFSLQLSQQTLMQHAAQLGSDCPFFIQDSPMMVSGRGEVLQPIDFSLAGDYIKLIHPNIHVSTAEAYSMLNPVNDSPDYAKLLNNKSAWKSALRNDFEKPIAKKFPLIQELIDALYQQGAYYAAMSGSGSAVFGLFEQVPQCEDQYSYFQKVIQL